jgi:hypothetical protein
MNSIRYDRAELGPKISPPHRLAAYRELAMILAQTDPQLIEPLLGKFPGLVELSNTVFERSRFPEQGEVPAAGHAFVHQTDEQQLRSTPQNSTY